MRQWARRGTRPRQPADQRYANAYLFGAICPAKGKGAALALPYVDTEMMQLHLDEISRHVEKGAHAVLLLDRAGWHTTAKLVMPKNITPILLPSRAPELNPVENDEIMNERAPHAGAAKVRIDEKVFEVTSRRRGPTAFMQHRDREAGDTRVYFRDPSDQWGRRIKQAA